MCFGKLVGWARDRDVYEQNKHTSPWTHVTHLRDARVRHPHSVVTHGQRWLLHAPAVVRPDLRQARVRGIPEYCFGEISYGFARLD